MAAVTAAAGTAVKKVELSPSPFAQLFRRSKFASYDPTISQVYTNYGGDAARGNWGLKRVVPLRARTNAYITVKEVDSREQQTFWNSGQRQARWIKRWEELNLHTGGPAHAMGQENRVDSEFCPEPFPREKDDKTTTTGISGETREGVEARRQELLKRKQRSSKPVSQESAPPVAQNQEGLGEIYIPNIESMTEKQFVRYIEKLRPLRSQFLQFVRENATRIAHLDAPPLQVVQEPSLYHRRFLAKLQKKALQHPESTIIEKRPHPSGGLMYSHPSKIETFYTVQPIPGYILQEADDPHQPANSKREAFIAGVAGITTVMRRDQISGSLSPLFRDVSEGIQLNPLKRAEGSFRPTRAHLSRLPQVVGARQGLNGARMDPFEVRDVSGTDYGRANPHPPGTREYVAMEPVIGVSVNKYLYQPSRRRPRKENADHAMVTGYKRYGEAKLLDTLKGIISIYKP